MLEDRNLKHDLFALGLFALVLFLGVSLATYERADPPSTLVYPPSDTVENACGRGGALAAHYLLQGLGYGAYYLVLSLAVWDAFLLLRWPIGQPVLRGLGWLATLLGMATVATMLMPSMSPGPVIGAGGYLGAAGRGLLEMHFAAAGAYILMVSTIVAGLLLCTDYVLVRFAARSVAFVGGGMLHAGRVVTGRGVATKEEDATDEEDEYEEDTEEEDKYEYEEEEEAEEPAVRILGKSQDDEPESDALDEVADEAEDTDDNQAATDKPADEPEEKTGVRRRLASALRIKKPKKTKKKSQRDEVIEEIEAASEAEEVLDYELPPLDLLLESENISFEEHEKEVRHKARLLEKAFANFGLRVKVVEIETGPVIAQYEVKLEAGLRLSRITGLADDLAIALRVPSVRIVAPIPGKNTVGIEVPNENRQIVRLREVIEESNGRTKRMKIPIYLGKDVAGKPIVVDLTTLPHLLIAGRTGTGKSVCLNSIIVSILMGRRPDEVRLLLIDPKMVELSPYKRLPHLMHPVVTDMRKAEAILAWAVDKMEERYAMLARAGVRHVSVYNQLGEEELRERIDPESDEDWAKVPKQLSFIVIVADELADLMMTSGKEVEQHIIRLAQKSRAVGIHLILATQKPTVDVITGLIKSNLPARIAFQVASRTDSRVVLDEMGADKLLGNGDMLYLSPGMSMLLRGQGTYLSDDEITAVIDHVGTDQPQFVKELVQLKTKDTDDMAGKLKNRDELYESAVDVVIREGRGSVSLLQRTLGIGYGRAARLIDYMAEDGIVGEYNGSQAREVLMSVEDWDAMTGQDPSPEPSSTRRSNRIVPDHDESDLDEDVSADEVAEDDSLWEEDEEEEVAEDDTEYEEAEEDDSEEDEYEEEAEEEDEYEEDELEEEYEEEDEAEEETDEEYEEEEDETDEYEEEEDEPYRAESA